MGFIRRVLNASKLSRVPGLSKMTALTWANLNFPYNNRKRFNTANSAAEAWPVNDK